MPALKKILEFIFSNYKIIKVIAEIEVNNHQSIRVIEKLGFKRIAINQGACIIDNISTDEYKYELAYKD